MDTEVFWGVLDTARGGEEPFEVAVAAHLAGCGVEEILAFEYCFAQLRHAVHRWDVWAAAYLIGGGCSDDRFSDFTAGLVALGSHWYERVAASPDVLAEHPAVRAAAASCDQDVVFAEEFNFVSCHAYAQLTGDEDSFWQAWEAYSKKRAMGGADRDQGMGEPFDFDSAEEMHRRLPQLAALYNPS
ncbi:DUF4240 domain-containing protein [Streptomyces sp. NPDC015684]|uniref:DUF4240 domain-containing protein n=1 Tax=Streptomyces sp. NPDC015684 TaxID=3364963 RepID=UPI0036FDED38